MEISDIKNYMKEKKITQETLAEKSNISISTIKKIMSGYIQHPRLDTINAICEALELDNSLPTQPTVLNGNFRLGIKNKIFVFDNSGDKYEFNFKKEELEHVLKICKALSND